MFLVISAVGSDPSSHRLRAFKLTRRLAAETTFFRCWHRMRSDLIRSLGQSLIPVLSNVEPVPGDREPVGHGEGER
jgi:hypothetical protein